MFPLPTSSPPSRVPCRCQRRHFQLVHDDGCQVRGGHRARKVRCDQEARPASPAGSCLAVMLCPVEPFLPSESRVRVTCARYDRYQNIFGFLRVYSYCLCAGKCLARAFRQGELLAVHFRLYLRHLGRNARYLFRRGARGQCCRAVRRRGAGAEWLAPRMYIGRRAPSSIPLCKMRSFSGGCFKVYCPDPRTFYVVS